MLMRSEYICMQMYSPGLRPKFSLSQHLRVQVGECCDRVIGERCLAIVLSKCCANRLAADENLRITSGRYKKHSEGERTALPIF
jgi:hypothetical protein